MKIVIDMPEEDYIYIAKKHCLPSCDDRILRKIFYEMIVKGTPLPKGHGRLIDSDDMIEDLHRQCKEVFKLDAVKPEDYYIAKDAKFMQATWKEWCDSFCVWANNRKTIVEADGGDEE